ncbi:MAG: hypothetical protein M3Y56_05960, partial [Armatimonadota bacterium]|nr:hypothetical protein [Armatimonadota bacterium]
AVTLLGIGHLPVKAADGVHPIVAVKSGYLLGATAGGRWLKATKAAHGIAPSGRYRIYSLTGAMGTGTGSRPKSQGAPCEDTLFVNLHRTNGKSLAGAEVAVGCSWPAMRRVPQLEPTNQRLYRNVIRGILRQHGIRDPRVHISQVLRVDLDGDGAAEVLITATHYASTSAGSDSIPGHSTQAGDYSIVVLRKMVRGRVRNIVIDGEFYTKGSPFAAPNTSRVIGILDLKGDGKMEIITQSRYYEGDSVAVWQVTGSRVRNVLSEGCGA